MTSTLVHVAVPDGAAICRSAIWLSSTRERWPSVLERRAPAHRSGRRPAANVREVTRSAPARGHAPLRVGVPGGVDQHAAEELQGAVRRRHADLALGKRALHHDRADDGRHRGAADGGQRIGGKCSVHGAVPAPAAMVMAEREKAAGGADAHQEVGGGKPRVAHAPRPGPVGVRRHRGEREQRGGCREENLLFHGFSRNRPTNRRECESTASCGDDCWLAAARSRAPAGEKGKRRIYPRDFSGIRLAATPGNPQKHFGFIFAAEEPSDRFARFIRETSQGQRISKLSLPSSVFGGIPMFKFKVTLLAATVAGGFALIGAASAGPLSTSPISAPTDVEQTEAQVQAQGRQNVGGPQNVQGRQNTRRSTANRSRHVRRYRGYDDGYS